MNKHSAASHQSFESLVKDTENPLSSNPIAAIETELQANETKLKAIPLSTCAASLADLRRKFLIDLTKPIPPIPHAIEIVGKSHTAPIACYGAITLVTAKAKSGKTFAHSILVSALIKGSELSGRIRPHYPVGTGRRRKVVIFDTEQSSYHAQRLGNRIETLAGLKGSTDLEVWMLRILPNDEKKQIIEQVIYGDPDLCAVVIDGVRDTVFDINSSEEACRATSELLKWAEEKKISIIAILHQNKADNNARGHLGTELKNKAEIIVNVSKDKDTGSYSVEAEDCRDKEFESFAFKIDDAGIPYLVNDFIPAKKADGEYRGRQKKLTANQVPDSQHRDLLRDMFPALVNPTYSQLIAPLTVAFQAMGVDLGERRTKEFIAYYKQKGWLFTETVEGSKYPVYRFK